MEKKMKLDVLNCIETDRGLIVSLEVDEEGRQYLIERGFNALLIDVIEKMENSYERETPEGI
jgi:DNA-dependent RNA polymerase auxiliary subunit epsilon